MLLVPRQYCRPRQSHTGRLNGPDASNVSGTYSAPADTITVVAAYQSAIADGANEDYTVNGFFNDNSGLTSGNTVMPQLPDGDTASSQWVRTQAPKWVAHQQ